MSNTYCDTKKDIIIDGISLVDELKNGNYVNAFYYHAMEYTVDSQRHHRLYEEEVVSSGERSDNKISEDILVRFFREDPQYSKNGPNDIEAVLIKVTLLNAFYRTSLNNIHLVAIARHICSLGFDERIVANTVDKPNFDLVHDIAYSKSKYLHFPVKVGKKVSEYANNMYSFASKYCAWHRPDLYPIVDSYTKGVLYKIVSNKESELYMKDITKAKMLNDYEIYYSIYKKLFSYLNKILDIDIPDYKSLDIFLWSFGEKFGIKNTESDLPNSLKFYKGANNTN